MVCQFDGKNGRRGYQILVFSTRNAPGFDPSSRGGMEAIKKKRAKEAEGEKMNWYIVLYKMEKTSFL